MKKALISPDELVLHPKTQEVLGIRVVQTSNIEFDVAPPLFWIECDNEVIEDEYYYVESSNKFFKFPKISTTIVFDELF